METNSTEKKSKSVKSSAHASIRVRKDTRKRVLTELARINKKDFGKNVRADELIALAVSLVTSEHIVKLQEGSLSNSDRLERDYRTYVAQHGHIAKDEYLGKRLNGEIPNSNDSEKNSNISEKKS